jgi:ribose transport system permease protein
VSFIVQSIDISFGRGLQIKPPPGFAAATSLSVGGLPVAAALAVLVSAGFAVLLHKTVFGREVTAIGQNLRAARLAGIEVARVRFLTYVLCGALGGLNGALLAGYFRGASVDLGNEYLLASIAVVVIGGTSVAGGQATVAGLWGAALFLVFLQIMLNAINAGAGLRLVVTGLVIVAVITAAAPGRKNLR